MQVPVPTGLDSRLCGNDGGGNRRIRRSWWIWRAEARPCISELPYHSDKPPGRHPRPPKADNRCAAQGAAGQPIGTTGQLPDNTT
ncbi:TPA: hypothetical protein ACKNYB_002118, partial [Neisseria gonorrhoeae]